MYSKTRPSSTQSRTAWADFGHALPDNQFQFDNDGNVDNGDIGTLSEDGGVKNKSRSDVISPSTSSIPTKSCAEKIGSTIRSLWATRLTENVSEDKELHVKTTLRELITYIIFLTFLCLVTFSMTSTNMYYFTSVMKGLFVDAPSGNTTSNFGNIASAEDFWTFAKGALLDGLYWQSWYNNDNLTSDQLGYIFYENKLLGVPRLRQLQVHSNSCKVHDDFKDIIKDCYDSYSKSYENKEPFGVGTNGTAWSYQTEEQLGGSTFWGTLATYSGAGYVQDLTQDKDTSASIIDDLFTNRWISRGTRAVFIDFTVYNANINLFCVMKLVVEFPATGGAISLATLRTVKLIRYVTQMDYFIMACEFIVCLYMFYYIVEEILEIKKHKWSYFKSFWNILDILVILIIGVCTSFNIYRTLKVNEMLRDLLNKPASFVNFEFLSYGQSNFDNAVALAVFFAWIKIFKYISFNKTMTQLSSTLGRCANDLLGFGVMFSIIFLAFTQLGYLLFGTQAKDFHDFSTTFFTLFRIILGDFNFEQLQNANRVLGPLYFILFVFFVFFVLINMFLAIINDTYSEVKNDIANQKNEFEMADYFMKGYEKMLSKLNFKHDKIVGIQHALKSADINYDKKVDFSEWRQYLKKQGYAEGDIEALFSKYDVDGDRVLDEEEQRNMLADLTEQEKEINKEYDEMIKSKRPPKAPTSESRISFNDDSDEEIYGGDSPQNSSRLGPSQTASNEEFTMLSRRVDRIEQSIGSIVSKIDAVLLNLECIEKAKLKRKEAIGNILETITQSETTNEAKSEHIEKLVRQELERWDSEYSIAQEDSKKENVVV